jgi:putative ABC transport system substrate-binding protein
MKTTNYFDIICILFVLLLSGCTPQTQEQKIYRVGILSGLSWFEGSIDGFKAKMAGLGYSEGIDIIYDIHKTNLEPAKERQIIKQFVAEKVDLIFVFPTETASVAKTAVQGTNIPVVFANSFLEGSDLVKSVREPGGNITGVRFPGPQYAAKRLEILHELAPKAKRILVIYDETNPNNPPTLTAMHPTADGLGLTLVKVPVNDTQSMKTHLEMRSRSDDIGVDAILVMPDLISVIPDNVLLLDDFSVSHGLPLATPMIPSGKTIPLFGYASDVFEVGELASLQADKILKGAQAGAIPVISPEAKLHINYTRALALGLTVPKGLLARADVIIR